MSESEYDIVTQVGIRKYQWAQITKIAGNADAHEVVRRLLDERLNTFTNNKPVPEPSPVVNDKFVNHQLNGDDDDPGHIFIARRPGLCAAPLCRKLYSAGEEIGVRNSKYYHAKCFEKLFTQDL